MAGYTCTLIYFPAPDKRNIFGKPLKELDSDYPREEEGVNYFGDYNIVISATNQRICYNQTVYDDMLVEPTEYFGLTLSVLSNNARTPPGYNTAAVRIVDDDSKLLICYYLLLSIKTLYVGMAPTQHTHFSIQNGSELSNVTDTSPYRHIHIL